MNECTCAHPHAQQWVLSSGSIHNSTQHTAISDMCVYMYFCLRVCTRVSWFIVRVRGVFCECVWSVAQSRQCGCDLPVERALCSLSISRACLCVSCVKTWV